MEQRLDKLGSLHRSDLITALHSRLRLSVKSGGLIFLTNLFDIAQNRSPSCTVVLRNLQLRFEVVDIPAYTIRTNSYVRMTRLLFPDHRAKATELLLEI